MQPLAVIGEVVKVEDIAGADRISSVTVDCRSAGTWMGVASKDLRVGDAVTVFLQDALLPKDDRWAFMESRNARDEGCASIPLDQPVLPNL